MQPETAAPVEGVELSSGTSVPPVLSQRPPHLISCCALAILRFLIFKQGVLCLHSASNRANYVAGPAKEEKESA